MRRRGFVQAEMLVAAVAGLIIATGAVRLFSVSSSFFSYLTGTVLSHRYEAAEELFCFLDSVLENCGTGLPDVWNERLFSTSESAGGLPDWAGWHKALLTGDSAKYGAFHPVTEKGCNTLRLVSCAQSCARLRKEVNAKAYSRTGLYLNYPLKSRASGENWCDSLKASDWFVFPGCNVPGNIADHASGTSPGMIFSRNVYLPAGACICPLIVLTLRVSNGRVYVNFHDRSGTQPLIEGVERAEFLREGRLLTVRVLTSDGDFVAERSWCVGAAEK